MDDTLLKYDSVELSFGGNSVVHDISFSLRPGEILGLVGESGSGKSTVAKLITRLEAVTEGQIILDGQDITHLKGRALKSIYDKIQMVFQNPVGSFDPRKTLGHGIGESLKNRGIPKEEIRKKNSEPVGTVRPGGFLHGQISPSGQRRSVPEGCHCQSIGGRASDYYL